MDSPNRRYMMSLHADVMSMHQISDTQAYKSQASNRYKVYWVALPEKKTSFLLKNRNPMARIRKTLKAYRSTPNNLNSKSELPPTRVTINKLSKNGLYLKNRLFNPVRIKLKKSRNVV